MQAAVASESLPLVRALLDAHADPNVHRQQDGFSPPPPLLIAAAAGASTLVAALLGAGAAADATDRFGRGAADLARAVGTAQGLEAAAAVEEAQRERADAEAARGSGGGDVGRGGGAYSLFGLAGAVCLPCAADPPDGEVAAEAEAEAAEGVVVVGAGAEAAGGVVEAEAEAEAAVEAEVEAVAPMKAATEGSVVAVSPMGGTNVAYAPVQAARAESATAAQDETTAALHAEICRVFSKLLVVD